MGAWGHKVQACRPQGGGVEVQLDGYSAGAALGSRVSLYRGEVKLRGGA